MALQSNKAGPSRSTLSSNLGGFEYDVFLSFRGEDTRHNFTGLFHHILELQGIHAYFDAEDLHKGERIDEILVAISRSKILVPIFSKRYAESHWCLREVAKMVECYDGGQERHIIPVFFDIDPEDVSCQSGPFGAAFHKHQMEKKDSLSDVDGWKNALKYVGGISGFDLKSYNGDQRKLIRSITADLQNILATKLPLCEKEYLVGLETRAEKMLKCMDFQSKHARIVGIHGIGGVGKTTLARAIYNRNCRLFGASSFIENIRKESNSGLVHLQKQLIQDISKGKDKVEINNPSQATQKIRDMVRWKSVLIVLDDVDDHKLLHSLFGCDISYFSSGSRIIITTRQVGVLQLAGLQEEAIYMLEELDKEESLQLFNHHVFGDQEPGVEYIKLSKEVSSISSGIPLILEVFGSLFRTAESPEEWNELLKDLRLRQHSEIHGKLRICYDRLNDDEKIIFLDIACLLISKSSEDAMYVWEDQKLSPHLVIRSLKNKSLIKIKNGKFEMHDQIRDMGREIVLKESHLHTGSYGRLWCEEDVMEALTKPQGNQAINRGILLNLSEESKMELSTEAFELMSELRLLLINFSIFDHSDFGHFPSSLKWLEWKDCPLEALPLEIKFKSVVVLNLSRSFISRLWSGTAMGSSSKCGKKTFDGLKVLDLSCCYGLNATPNFAVAPNLKKLILDECKNLKEVDVSIGFLKQLVFLSMRECVSLEKLPSQIYQLGSLVVFNLEGCSNLVAFPQFPPTNSSTDGLSYLEELILRDCESLEFLPHLHKFQSLRSLHMDGCQSLDHRTTHLFEDVKLREWDELSISGSRGLFDEQEFSFLLPVGSTNDPLLLQQLQCHGFGDPCKNETIKLHVHHEDMENCRVIFETTYEADCDNSMYKDDVYGDCYSINFGWNDKINKTQKGKTIILKVRTANNFKLTKVDVKVQKRSKFSGENMKPFIRISKRNSQVEFSIFFGLHQADKFVANAIEYSTRIEKLIDDTLTQPNVQRGEQMLFFDWTIEELIILTLIFGEIDGSWYEQRHGTQLPRQETAKVFDKIKVLNLSYCKFLVKTPDLAWTPNLKELFLDHCECLLEIGESIGQLKNLILLSMVGCANLGALPCGILQLNSLQLLSLEGCPKIKILPEASMMDVRLESLQRLILDHCTALTEIPDYVGGLKCLHCLSLKGCRSLQLLPRSIGSLVVLEELILDDCTSLTKMPDDVGQLKCLRSLSLQGCFRLHGSIERPVALPGSLGHLTFLLNLWQLNLEPVLARILKKRKRLAIIPGLQKLRSLKVLHMNGCRCHDVHKIWSQLKKAAFDDLQAFSIGSRCSREVVTTISLPFPRGGMRNEPLQLERMDVLVWKESKTMEDDSVLNVGVAVGSRLFPAARPQMALQLRALLSLDNLEGPHCGRTYTGRFGRDDEINKRLRVEKASATRVRTLHISFHEPTAWQLEVDVWFRT